MEREILFTVKTFKMEDVVIYGPTNEKLENTRPVNSNVKYGCYIMSERREKMKILNSFSMRNSYIKEGKIDELEKQKNDVVKETNWKLRVLNEQEKENQRRLEAAETLLRLKTDEENRIRKEQIQEKAKKTRMENKMKQQEQPLRRSNRVKNMS